MSRAFSIPFFGGLVTQAFSLGWDEASLQP